MTLDRKVLAGVTALALAGGVAPFLPAYPLTLLTQAVIVAVFAMSLDVLLGYTGLPSLGHAAYFGIAAYAVGVLSTEHQVGLVGCLGAGLLLATATAALFGLLAIRATGTYFLMITLALGMVVWGLAFRWVSMTKGDNGIAGVPRPELGLPWSLSAPLPFFYFALVVAALAWAAMGVLVRSPFGLGLRGIRESESRMRALGYSVWLHKYLAFVISGFFAGVAGVLWAYYNGFVGPVDVQLVTSVETLLMVALAVWAGPYAAEWRDAQDRPSLIIELHGTRDEVADQLDAAGYEHSAIEVDVPTREAPWWAHVLATPREGA